MKRWLPFIFGLHWPLTTGCLAMLIEVATGGMGDGTAYGLFLLGFAGCPIAVFGLSQVLPKKWPTVGRWLIALPFAVFLYGVAFYLSLVAFGLALIYMVRF